MDKLAEERPSGRAVSDDPAPPPATGDDFNDLDGPLIIPPLLGPLGTVSFGPVPTSIPRGPLAMADDDDDDGGLSAVDELRLINSLVSDIARVCQAVTRGDLSQRITVPSQGAVMTKFKDGVNAMVRTLLLLILAHTYTFLYR